MGCGKSKVKAKKYFMVKGYYNRDLVNMFLEQNKDQIDIIKKLGGDTLKDYRKSKNSTLISQLLIMSKNTHFAFSTLRLLLAPRGRR